MRIDKKDSTKINFIAKGDPSSTSLLMVCVDLQIVCLGIVLLATKTYASYAGVADSVHLHFLLHLLFRLSLRNPSTRQRRRK